MGKFLVVASFHNNPDEHIDRTFDNVLSQTHKDWLLIVGDDFSDDPSAQSACRRRFCAPDERLRSRSQSRNTGRLQDPLLRVLQGVGGPHDPGRLYPDHQ